MEAGCEAGRLFFHRPPGVRAGAVSGAVRGGGAAHC